MGGYYGSPATILKNNRNLLKKHDRNKWKSLQTSYRKALKGKEASPELLAEIRKKFQKERRNKNQNKIQPVLSGDVAFYLEPVSYSLLCLYKYNISFL